MPGIHETFKQQVERAEICAEHREFYVAGQILRRLALTLERHADAANDAGGGPIRMDRVS